MTPQHGGAREGAGRPKGSGQGRTARTASFSATEEELALLDAAAAAVGMSRSEYLRQVISLGDAIVAIIRAKQAGDD